MRKISVKVGDRKQNTLQVLDKTRQLLIYTATICSNEKTFPKSKRWLFAQKIINECTDALTCVRRANSTFATNEEEWNYRKMQQIRAHAHLNAACTLMDVAYNVLNIETSTVEYWTNLMMESDNLLKSWIKSDDERRKTALK